MAEIVNLRRMKKARALAGQAAQAAANRALHGRTKAERAADEMARERREAVLDQARIEAGEGGGATDAPPSAERSTRATTRMKLPQGG
jgi:hypothetical protein